MRCRLFPDGFPFFSVPLCLRVGSAFAITSQPSQGLRRAQAQVCKANMLILEWLLDKGLSRRSNGMLNLKDLLAAVAASVGPTFSGFIGLMKRRESNSLILNLLFADWLRQTGQGLLNLKDLLTVFPSSLKGSFETSPF